MSTPITASTLMALATMLNQHARKEIPLTEWLKPTTSGVLSGRMDTGSDIPGGGAA